MIQIHNVLLVDDSVFMRKWISGILNDSNRYKVIAEASNGRDALLQYNSYLPDIVIMDLVMDEMDGIQALKHMVYLFPGIKVVMCSSLGQSSSISDCIRIGAKDFVTKPHFKNLIPILDHIAN